MEELMAGARQLGIELSDEQVRSFALYSHQLLEWNERVNLTAITDPREVQTRHFVDSLSCLVAMAPRDCAGRLVPQQVRGTAIDIGAGPGFPGLPLRLVCPQLRLTLVDSVGKKTRFLDHLIAALGLTGVTVITARAEDLARLPAHRERYDWCLARALAALPVLLEYCLPFLRQGGRLIAPKKGDLAAELAAARPALTALRGRLVGVSALNLPQLPDERALVVVEKTGTTAARYPRRAGLPAKQPIGSREHPATP